MEATREGGQSRALAQANIDPRDDAALDEALRRLHSTKGVIVRATDLLASVLGSAAGLGLRRLRLPEAVSERALGLTEALLRRALEVATLGLWPTGGEGRGMFRVVAAVSGGIGGFAGLGGFLPDVALTTLLIMRRIAAIAAEEGEDLSSEAGRAACIEVFAFGSTEVGETPEFGYWSARLLVQGRPLMLVISEAAASYGIRLSQKFALQILPLVGAAGGALVNTAFLDHYESLARVHFMLRRLERQYGAAVVKAAVAARLRAVERSAS